MRGQEGIIAMRMRGQKPAMVYVDSDPDKSALWRDWPGVCPATPSVWVQPDDVPHRLDLRFLVGLTAVISGTDAERLQALERAALDAGATRTVVALLQPCVDRSEPSFRTVRVTDSQYPGNNTDPLTPEAQAWPM